MTITASFHLTHHEVGRIISSHARCARERYTNYPSIRAPLERPFFSRLAFAALPEPQRQVDRGALLHPATQPEVEHPHVWFGQIPEHEPLAAGNGPLSVSSASASLTKAASCFPPNERVFSSEALSVAADWVGNSVDN